MPSLPEHPARILVLCLSLGVAGSAAASELPRPLAPETCDPIGSLKRTYLACEEAALAGRIGGAEAMVCSVIYEDLKRTAFGGSAARLRDWYRAVTALDAVGTGVPVATRRPADCT